MRNRLSFLAIVAVLAATAIPASAQTINGALGAPDLTYNRPLAGTPPSGLSGVGTAVFFDAYTFTVPVTGSYTMALTSTFDNFLTLYTPSFNRLSPLTNALAANDDTNGSNAQITATLTTGLTYVAVATSFTNAATGTYALVFTGPGAISLVGGGATGPEPATLALLAVGAVGLLARRRR